MKAHSNLVVDVDIFGFNDVPQSRCHTGLVQWPKTKLGTTRSQRFNNSYDHDPIAARDNREERCVRFSPSRSLKNCVLPADIVANEAKSRNFGVSFHGSP